MLKKQLLGGLATAALLLASCSTGTTSESDFVIGGIAPLSGDAAGIGSAMQNAIELAVADVNTAWAEKGMTLDITWEDGQCTGQSGAAAAQKLINVDGMQLILGGLCSSETLGAAPIAEEAGVVLFSSGSSSPDVTTAGEYVYRNWPSDAYQGIAFANLAEDMGWEKVGVITELTEYTEGISNSFAENFTGEAVEESFLSEDNDVKTQLTKLAAEEVDVIFVNVQTEVKADLVFSQMQEQGIAGPFILNDVAGTHTTILTDYADFIEGSYTATFNVDTESADYMAFEESYMTAYGEELSFASYQAAAYDATWLLAGALAEAGNDGATLKAYLDAYSGYNGLTGNITFDSNGDLNGGHSVFMIEGGELVAQ